jgi:hypothetical protein
VDVLNWVPAGIDINAASAARIHDYHLGGLYNFPADRWVAERAAENLPELPAAVRVNRAFLQRAVRFLAAAGVRQFLDLGSGIPTAGNVHQIAHTIDPTARVVYVDVDPVAVAHGSAMLAGIYSAAMVRADLRDVRSILTAPPVREMIDFSEPVGVLMVSVLHLLSDSDDPAGVIAQYRDAVPAGSHFVVSHPGPAAAVSRPAAMPMNSGRHLPGQRSRSRTTGEITAWFDGWDLAEPGVTRVGRWRVDAHDPGSADHDLVTDLGGVGRKR